MTIAVTIKVHDGIVVASDSATTMVTHSPNGQDSIANIYDNANKIFNLVRGLPIGAVTAGAGSIGHSSIATLAKDLRRRFSGLSPDHLEWKLDGDNYTIEEVANRARKFLYEEKWTSVFKENLSVGSFDFWVFGYSANQPLSELWKISVRDGECGPPVLAKGQNETGIDSAGQPEAITRLVYGVSPELESILRGQGATPEQAMETYRTLASRLAVPLYTDPMPIIDAIELAEFLVEATAKFTRFNVGAATVGGPIEIAAITRHEHFKWVRRKHYFDARLNPEVYDG